MLYLKISEGGWMVIGFLFISTLDLYVLKFMFNETKNNESMYGGNNFNQVLMNTHKYRNLINI